MAYRKRRYRRSNPLGGIVSDTARDASRMTWEKALIVGIIGYALFYFLVPSIIHSIPLSGSQASKIMQPLIERRFIRPSELAGIAILLVALVIAGFKYFGNGISREGASDASFLSRLLARFLD